MTSTRRGPTARTVSRLVASTAVAALALATTACGSSGSSGQDSTSSASSAIPAGDIKVGLILPLSGALAGVGAGIEDAITAFVDQLNASGGIKGHKLQLVVENDQNDPALGATAAEELKSAGVVAAFAGGISTDLAQALPVLMKEKILVIENAATDVYSLDVNKYPYFFSTEPINAVNMKYMAQYAKQLGVKTVGTITDGLPYSLNNRSDFDTAAKELGLSVPVQVTYSPTALDLTTQVSQLKSANVGAIAATTQSQLGALYAAVKQLHWNPIILGNAYTPLVDAAQATTNTLYPCLAPLDQGQTPPAGTIAAIGTLKRNGGLTGTAPNLAPIYRDEVQMFARAVSSANSLDAAKLATVLESFKAVSFTAPVYQYTYTGTNHALWSGKIGACHVSSVSPDGLPYAASASS